MSVRSEYQVQVQVQVAGSLRVSESPPTFKGRKDETSLAQRSLFLALRPNLGHDLAQAYELRQLSTWQLCTLHTGIGVNDR